MNIHPTLAILISIVFMAATIVFSARVILRIKPLPYGKALVIAAVSNLLGKLFVSVIGLPGWLSYSLPTLAFLVLSYYFFGRPKITRLVVYWLLGFAAYLAIHIVISSAFGWTFMFPFWKPRIFG